MTSPCATPSGLLRSVQFFLTETHLVEGLRISHKSTYRVPVQRFGAAFGVFPVLRFGLLGSSGSPFARRDSRNLDGVGPCTRPGRAHRRTQALNVVVANWNAATDLLLDVPVRHGACLHEPLLHGALTDRAVDRNISPGPTTVPWTVRRCGRCRDPDPPPASFVVNDGVGVVIRGLFRLAASCSTPLVTSRSTVRARRRSGRNDTRRLPAQQSVPAARGEATPATASTRPPARSGRDATAPDGGRRRQGGLPRSMLQHPGPNVGAGSCTPRVARLQRRPADDRRPPVDRDGERRARQRRRRQPR